MLESTTEMIGHFAGIELEMDDWEGAPYLVLIRPEDTGQVLMLPSVAELWKLLAAVAASVAISPEKAPFATDGVTGVLLVAEGHKLIDTSGTEYDTIKSMGLELSDVPNSTEIKMIIAVDSTGNTYAELERGSTEFTAATMPFEGQVLDGVKAVYTALERVR